MSENVAISQDGKRKLCVGQLPGRARPSLYFWDPLGIETLASFKDDASAEAVKRFLFSMVGARVTCDGHPVSEEG